MKRQQTNKVSIFSWFKDSISIRTLLPLPFLTIFLFCIPIVVMGQDEEFIPKTLFLPLQIISSTNNEEITELADKYLGGAADTGLTFIDRYEISKKVNIAKKATKSSDIRSAFSPSDYDYVASGNLIQIGNRVSIDLKVYNIKNQDNVQYFFQEGNANTGLKQIFEKITKDVYLYTNRHRLISSIKVVGNTKIDSGAILNKVELRTGSLFDPLKLRQAIKTIFKMGYFDDVQIKGEQTATGRQIIFHVIEKEIIGEITITGEDAIKKEDIQGILKIRQSNIINAKDINDSIIAIKEFYKAEGYFNTEITFDQKIRDDGKIDIGIIIKEGIKAFIKDITITGNKAFTRKKLLKVIQTSEKGWLSWINDSGLLNYDIIEQDASRISSHYHNNGYIEAKVGKPEITQQEEWFNVNFNIFEGERYEVGTIDINGELLAEKAILLGLTKLGKNQYFSRKVLREDILNLNDYYAERGYSFAEIKPITSKDPQTKKVNVVIDIIKKELIHVNRIVIRGNSRTRDKVIRREIIVKEKGIFNATALRKSQQQLQRLEFFEDVKITSEPTGEEGFMDVFVTVKEQATGKFSIGAGYSSVDELMFMSEVSQNNFIGKGQKIALSVNVSGKSTQYNINFTEPHLADTKLLFGIDLYNWTREYDDYDKDSEGVGLRLGYPIWEKWRMYGSYSYDDTLLTDVDIEKASQVIIESMDINSTSAVKLGFSRDSRNRLTNATKGSQNSFSVKYAGGDILQGDSEFTKFDISTSWYYPLPLWKFTFHHKLSVGWAYGDKLPVFEKYYLGGINTIRGFDAGSISPRDPVTNEKIGGAKKWFTNIELIFPLVEDAGLRGALFIDAGNVYEKDEDWDLGDIKKSVGIGFRWQSPMGPLRLAYGYNLDPQGDETRDNWDFSIGGAF